MGSTSRRRAQLKPPRLSAQGKSRSDAAHRFVGVSLSGGKNDRTAVAVLEFFQKGSKGPGQLFLSHLYDHVRAEDEATADTVLLELLNHVHGNSELIGVDAPLTRPLCSPCAEPCDAFERCTRPHVQWMISLYKSRREKKNTLRIFSPYTERAVEQYFNAQFEPDIHIQACLGSNLAPLTARMGYLRPRIKSSLVEVLVRVSVLRLGLRLRLSRKHLLSYRNSLGGEESRAFILRALSDRKLIFLYEQDIQKMIEHPASFEALFCALTAKLWWSGECELPPQGFPRGEGWVAVPAL